MKRPGLNSVFLRLRRRFMLLIAFAFGLILLFLLQYIYTQQDKELSTLKGSVSQSATLVEQQIDGVINYGQTLFSDPRMERMSIGYYQDNYERNEMILDLQSSIHQTTDLNGIIEDITLTFPERGIRINAEDGYDKREYDPEMFYLDPAKRVGFFFLQDGQLHMIAASPMLPFLADDMMPDYEIDIRLSGSYLQGLLSPFASVDARGAFWVFAQGEEATPLDDAADASLLSSWLDAWKSSGCPDILQTRVQAGGENVQFVSQTIARCGLILVTWQSTRELFQSLNLTLIGLAAVIFIMLVLTWLLVNWARKRISKPVYTIMEASEKVQSGDLDVRIRHERNDEFSAIYDTFNDTIRKTKELMESTKEQERLLQKAEMLQLQSQINPHFLYNSFYNIKFMAQNEDYEQIDAMVTALAKYYRFLNKETEDTVTLEAEAAHMANYIAVQQMRFGDKISVEIQSVPEEIAHFKVPKLILQPVVENAYNYGLKNILADGLLSVRYHMEDERLEITVEDNGGGMSVEKLAAIREQLTLSDGSAENHALSNINRRLKLSFGEGSGVFLAINDAAGLIVTLRMNTK